MEDAGLLHGVEHLLRLGGGAGEGLGAEDALAGAGGGRDRLEVEVVREADDHEVHVRGEETASSRLVVERGIPCFSAKAFVFSGSRPCTTTTRSRLRFAGGSSCRRGR